MQNIHTDKHLNDLEEINLREVFFTLWQEKKVIISITAFISIIGIIYSLSLPNIYTSKAILVPVEPANSMSGNIGGYAGIAGLAGIRLPNGSNNSNALQAIEKIGSLSFFENNILPNIFLPNLLAVDSWSSKTNTLTYDDSIYISDSNIWPRYESNPNKEMPTAQDGYGAFKRNLNLSQDKKTGFITLSIKHQSPFIAKQWVELIIDEVNAFYRQKDKLESEKAVSYLNQQITMTSLSEIKEVLAQLLQEETKKLTLIEANEFFVFDYIDPPAVLEKKSEPKRSFIFVLSTIFGAILGIIFILIRHYFFNKKS